MAAKYFSIVAVVVEMVAGEVRERRDVEAHALDPMLVERVRRDFHRHASHAAIDERAKDPLQLDRSRCREAAASLERLTLAADQDAERSDRRAARLTIVEQVAEHADRRRLAVGPGDGDQLEVVRGAAEEGRGSNRRRAARIADNERG